jgi:hypothetical protein
MSDRDSAKFQERVSKKPLYRFRTQYDITHLGDIASLFAPRYTLILGFNYFR